MNRLSDSVFIFATLREARPFLCGLDGVRVEPAGYAAFRGRLGGHPLHVAICGMGIDAATAATADLLDQYPVERIFNCGIVGSLNPSLGVGAVVAVNCAQLLDADDRPVHRWEASGGTARATGLPEAGLLTLTSPLFDAGRKRRLAALGDLVDLEGAAIARQCQARRVDCRLIKVVSDLAESRAQLHGNLDAASEILARRLLREGRDCHGTPRDDKQGHFQQVPA
jgi:nucleoside phosphorylase